LEGLGEFNVTHGQIEEVVELLRAVEETWYGYEREKGNAQAATKARDAAVAELNTWMRNARPIARIAVAEQPQLLEKLGILVRS
jgi:hypothetical protein